jgi:hypothetical protein
MGKRAATRRSVRTGAKRVALPAFVSLLVLPAVASAASVSVSGAVLTLRADAGDSGLFSFPSGLQGGGRLRVATATATLAHGPGCGPPAMPSPGMAGQAEWSSAWPPE